MSAKYWRMKCGHIMLRWECTFPFAFLLILWHYCMPLNPYLLGNMIALILVPDAPTDDEEIKLDELPNEDDEPSEKVSYHTGPLALAHYLALKTNSMGKLPKFLARVIDRT